MVFALVTNPHYWQKIGQFDMSRLTESSAPIRLLEFVANKVLKPHYGGRLYADSGEKWAVADKGVTTLCAIIDSAIKMAPAMMPLLLESFPTLLDQLRDVIKILDSGTLVQVIQWLTVAAYMANKS